MLFKTPRVVNISVRIVEIIKVRRILRMNRRLNRGQARIRDRSFRQSLHFIRLRRGISFQRPSKAEPFPQYSGNYATVTSPGFLFDNRGHNNYTLFTFSGCHNLRTKRSKLGFKIGTHCFEHIFLASPENEKISVREKIAKFILGQNQKFLLVEVWKFPGWRG